MAVLLASPPSTAPTIQLTAQSRRAALAVGVALVSAATADSASRPALAAYGEPAKVFGRPKKESGFVPYVVSRGDRGVGSRDYYRDAPIPIFDLR